MTARGGPIERVLPHSIRLEQAVLGAVLAGHIKSNEVFDFLNREDFFDNRHRAIFEKMVEIRNAGQSPDLLIMHDELSRSGELDNAGGIAYLAQLGELVARAGELAQYLRSIKDKAWLRAALHTASAIQEAVFTANESAAAVIARAIEAFSELASKADSERDEGSSFHHAAFQLLSEIESGPGIRIFSDIDELDRLTGGFRPGELIIVTAETGTGKTLFAQQVRRRACKDGRHGLFCTGEMLGPHLVSREIAAESHVDPWKLRRPERISPIEWQALRQAASRECKTCRILDGELSLSRIQRVSRGIKLKTGLDCIVLDYDELIDAPGETEYEQQRALARGAKSLAMELACPVILISQLRKLLRDEESRRPTLQRVYGSAAKCKHASAVFYIDRIFVRELKGDETAARIVVLKNRDGRVGALEAIFNVQTLKFESGPTDKEQKESTWEHPREPTESE